MKRIIFVIFLVAFTAVMYSCWNIQNKNVVSEQPAASLVRSFNCVDSFDFYKHQMDMYNNAAYKFHFKGTTKPEFENWQNEYKAALKEKLGLNKMAAQLKGYKPKVVKENSEDLGFAIREYWRIWTEPTVDLPFVLLLPKDIKGTAPLMITPHGHESNLAYAGIYANENERKAYEGLQDIALQAVKRGFITILPTTRGIRGMGGIGCARQVVTDALVGRTAVGDRVWDVEKVLDWALETLSVDKSRVIITGNSGGGCVTLWAGALDDRFAVSSPHGFVCSFIDGLGLLKHCSCSYVPGILDYSDVGDIAALTAPRLLCIAHGDKDGIFPIASVKKEFVQTQKVYAAAGVPNNCELKIGDGGHRYYSAEFWSFLSQHIKF